MSEPEHRNGSLINTTGRVASQVVGGFTGQPMLLLVLILNVIMIGAASYFLAQQEHYRRSDREQFMNLLTSCLHVPATS